MSGTATLAVLVVMQSTGTLVPNRESSAVVGSIGALRTTTPEPAASEQQPTQAALAYGRGMATCLWKRYPRSAADLLNSEDVQSFSNSVRQAMHAMQACSSEQMHDFGTSALALSNSSLRGLVAEARFRHDGFPRLGAINYSSVTVGSDWITTDPGQKVVLRTADCLAATQPERAMALLYAAPDSIEEKSTFSALAPAIPSCLEQGVSLSANRAGMRLALASAIDRRTRLAGASAGKKN